jgi:hypothetical protein
LLFTQSISTLAPTYIYGKEETDRR